MKKYRTLLVSAYGCEPGTGSEQGVGWNWVIQMAKNNKLHVITRANNREKIEGNIPKEVADNIVFYYYDTLKILRCFKKKAHGLYVYYFFWQIGILSLVRNIIKQYAPDYTMHLTFGSMWMPTFLHLFRTPFIWGPVGGGDCEPVSFFKILPLRQRFQAYLRLVLIKSIPVNPFIRLLCARSCIILCRTKSSGDVLPQMYDGKKHVILETAIEEVFDIHKSCKTHRTINLISVGRLMPSKNIITAIRALHLPSCRGLNIKYTIIGSGPEKKKIKDEIQRLNLEDRVVMVSEIHRKEVLGKLLESDIFIFPSLREGGSWALMEAMAAALPVVCLRWSGMDIITNDACAKKLSVSTPEQMEKDMATAICMLAESSELRCQMGKVGLDRIREVFNWRVKGEFMETLFQKYQKDNGYAGAEQ